MTIDQGGARIRAPRGMLLVSGAIAAFILGMLLLVLLSARPAGASPPATAGSVDHVPIAPTPSSVPATRIPTGLPNAPVAALPSQVAGTPPAQVAGLVADAPLPPATAIATAAVPQEVWTLAAAGGGTVATLGSGVTFPKLADAPRPAAAAALAVLAVPVRAPSTAISAFSFVGVPAVASAARAASPESAAAGPLGARGHRGVPAAPRSPLSPGSTPATLDASPGTGSHGGGPGLLPAMLMVLAMLFAAGVMLDRRRRLVSRADRSFSPPG